MKNLTCCLSVILFLTGCTQKVDFTVPVWHCVEIPFTADKAYDNPLTGTELCEMDVVFTHSDGTEICRPAFWDGENIFKVRFAPVKPGRWQYRTACEQERSLEGIKGFIKAVEYDGSLEIFRHGFLTVSDNKRYFIYNDGKPFFYVGDTHWSMPFEAFESSNVPDIVSQFKYIVDTRIEQGFNVYQSEPIQWKNHTGHDEIYDLTAFGPEVLGGFANLDRKFKYLADKGMVHANAQLFFANELGVKMEKYPHDYIESLTRYWVARYGAYPVMWTCAQEVDNDFYFDRENNQRDFDAESNPWKIVAGSLYKYDAYHHPLTAHMEYASGEALNDGHGTIASNSSFKNIEGHNWYACQWSPTKKGQLDFRVPKDFWNSRPVKPTVNYEGHYDHFWTNTFGARMQGWTAYLNGMFGYGYGAAGIWLIINSYPDDLAGAYDLHRDTDDEITKEVKRMPWNEALFLPAAEQTGKYMRQFFESLEWWNLTPRFDDAGWSDLKDAYYSLATIENDVYVCYFYNPGTVTGKLKNLNPGTSYTAQWFDPQNGQYRRIGAITSDSDGVWEIPAKPSDDDWVLLLKGGIVNEQTQNAKSENFKNPPLGYHMNLNTHGVPSGEDRQKELLDNYLLAGYGGLTANVNWTDDYLKNDQELSSFYQFVRFAKERDMEVWLYDEKLYPSGMAGDHILKEHPDWEAEGLLFKDTLVMGGINLKMNSLPGKILIAKAIPVDNNQIQFDKGQEILHRINNGTLEWETPAGQWKIIMISTNVLYHGFQSGTERGGVIPRYTSLLMPEVTSEFIKLTHKKYADFSGDKLGNLFFATFTDEPSAMAMPYNNLGYGVYPWKDNVAEAFGKRYGYPLEEQLVAMMLDDGVQGQKVRTQYFSIIADFMSNYYFKPIKDFCRQQGFKSGGHLLLEESMMAHVPLYGNIMSCFREMDIPGIDVLTGMPDFTRRYLISGRLAASAAELEGNTMVMSEICPIGDYPVHSGKEAPTMHIKGTVNRQLIAGVTKFNNYLRLQHEDNTGKTTFNQYVARISMMMSGGKRASRIGVYYPIETLWAKYRPFPAWLRGWDDVQGGDDAAQHLDRMFVRLSYTLFDNHWEFSYIDTKGLEENDHSQWDVLILPGVETITEKAMEKITDFCRKGGKVIAIESLPVNSLSDFPSATVKKFVADIPQSNIHFEKAFNRDNLDHLLNNLVKRELTIYPKENVLCSHKIIDGKNVFLVTNDNSHSKELIIDSNDTQSMMVWNPQTGSVTPMIIKRINLGPFESVIITNDGR